jgi:hypothetical protein
MYGIGTNNITKGDTYSYGTLMLGDAIGKRAYLMSSSVTCKNLESN